jgi:hypothetical protein
MKPFMLLKFQKLQMLKNLDGTGIGAGAGRLRYLSGFGI